MWFSAARRRYGNINTGVALFVKNVKSVPWVWWFSKPDISR